MGCPFLGKPVIAEWGRWPIDVELLCQVAVPVWHIWVCVCVVEAGLQVVNGNLLSLLHRTITPPPPNGTRPTATALKMPGPTPPAALIRGIVGTQRERTPAAKQCIVEAQTAMSMEVHQNHARKGGATSGSRTIPAPKLQEKLDLHRQPGKRAAKFHRFAAWTTMHAGKQLPGAHMVCTAQP